MTATAMKDESTSSKNRKRNKKRQRNPKPSSKEEPIESKLKSQKDTKINKNNKHGGSSSSSSSSSASKKRAKPSNFLDMLRERLSGGQFRMLNEKLYTCSGQEALDYFKEDPEMFDMYHTGYQQQMSNWPELPVNSIIDWLLSRSSSLVVADFGCGDARIAKSVKNKVFSFDLVSKNPSVIACDMSNTSLESSSVDVAVFCLSLMGTNYSSYIKEAHRVLRPSGMLLIAEVKSRFDPNNGGADPIDFVKAVCDLGFTSVLKVKSFVSIYSSPSFFFLVSPMRKILILFFLQDVSNKMFILLHFKKKEQLDSNQKTIKWPELKACLYKRR
ncbi:PREDICTED: ribosomal RNA-processing protein 8-like isoform X1 [Camelina sativa]|uniref:Ribosomal RNA-processing protein 8 n=1 Tax=Camelina sativa TaxID=90675 RepID=A0ABM1QRB5_CAMSA|nr:PREDICTED: ribosomal RNA-processing protein 8-like isoform X1 [Camelina sativa]